MTDPGETRWLRTVLVCIGALGVTAGFSRFSFSIALPQMTEDLFHSYSTAGAVVAVNFGVYVVAILLVRRYAAHVDPGVLAKAGVALTSAGLVVVALAPSTAVALVGTVALGLAAGGGFVPITSIIVTVAPPARRGLAMGLGLGGVGLSIVLTGQIVDLFERIDVAAAWRAAFGTEAAIGAVVLVLSLRLLPALPPMRGDRRPPRRAFARLPGAYGLLACYGIYGLAIAIYTGYLVAAAREDRGLSSSHAVLLSSLMGGSMAVAFVVGRLSDAIGRKRTIVGGIAVIALCCVAVPFGVEPWLAISAMGAGLCINGTGAVVGAYLGDHLTMPEVTSTMGVLTLAMATAQIVGPPLGGWLADTTGSFTATFLFATAAAGTASLIATRLPADHSVRRGGAERGLRLPVVE